MKREITRSRHVVECLIHIIGWGVVFGFPFLTMSRSGFNISWTDYMRYGGAVPLSFLWIFYLNYFLLIPHFLFKGNSKQYVLLNLILILCTATGVHWIQEHFIHHPVKMGDPRHHTPPPAWIFILRDGFSMVLTAGLAASIRMSHRWTKVEAARQEAEKNRTEAELKNLRNQLNPHFLLNTLNNIYALISFDSNKAQNAVQELSRLLRYVLYDNQGNFVSIDKEMEFIRNYIELMRIRLSDNIKVETLIDIRPESRTKISPLIFISLIENAFKHGISPTEHSFIRIHFSESPGQIRGEITNSFHPKSDTDKSGSGIGLEQVRKRLELIYPGRYEWQQGVSKDKKEYKSELIIYTGDPNPIKS